MDKEVLKKIRIRPKRELVKMAQEDTCIKRKGENPWGAFICESYATKRYIQADEREGLLVVSVWKRSALAAGRTEPVIRHFVDVENEKYISKVDTDINKTGWSGASFDWMMGFIQSEKGEHWNIAQDINRGVKLVNKKLGTEDDEIYDALYRWEKAIRNKTLKERKLRRMEAYKADLDLFAERSEDFERWISGEGFMELNFIFYRQTKNGQQALCTNCGEIFNPYKKLTHTASTPAMTNWERIPKKYCRCPKCGGAFTTKAWNRHKSIRIDKRAAMFRRIGDKLTARQVHIIFDFHKDSAEMWERQPWIADDMLQILDPKTVVPLKSYMEEYDSTLDKRVWKPQTWGSTSGPKPYTMQNTRVYTLNLQEALPEYATLTKTMIRHLDGRDLSPSAAIRTIIRKSYVEYMDKAGLKSLAKQTLDGRWESKQPNAKNLRELMEIDGNQLRRLKDMDGDLYVLEAIRYVGQHGEKIDDETLRFMSEYMMTVKSTQCERTGLTLQRAVNYIRKLSEKQDMYPRDIVGRYKDYLDLAEDLGMDIRDEIVCHNPKMMELHDRYDEEKKRREGAQRDIDLDKKYQNIEANKEKTEKHFAFENKELVIMVPGRPSDITEEGRRQHHCVGTNENYISRMNASVAFILFLRKKEAPDEPYYTLEVEYDGNVKQAYGKFDRKPDWEQVSGVLEKFTRTVRKRTDKERTMAG